MFLRSLKKGADIAEKALKVGAAATTSVACTTVIATSINSSDNTSKNKGFFKTAQAALLDESKPKEATTSKFKR